jgi:ribosomal protein L37E
MLHLHCLKDGTHAMNDRIKVAIRCNRCGDRFVLRGKKEKGCIDTGFKKCLCDNDHDFLIDEENV